MNIYRFFIIFLACCIGCGGGGTVKEDSPKGVSIEKGAPYLLLVSYQTPVFGNIGEIAIDTLEQSPYDGAASVLANPADLRVIPFSEYAAKIEYLNNNCEKRFWPWISANRLVVPAEPAHDESVTGYYRKVNTIELNEIGTPMIDFLETFRNALKIARETNSPGIVLDLEFFNNYACYSVSYIASQKKIPHEEVANMFSEIGDKLSAIIAEEYQSAVIWLLTTGLAVPDFEADSSGRLYYITPAYIVFGMLEGARKRNLWAIFVDGDKTSLGLYSKDIMELETKLNRREKVVTPLLQKYDGRLIHGGALAPWHDFSLLQGWIKSGVGDRSSYGYISDFGSTFDLLFDVYPCLWIYASSDAGYNPYDPAVAQLYNKEIARAKMRYWHRK